VQIDSATLLVRGPSIFCRAEQLTNPLWFHQGVGVVKSDIGALHLLIKTFFTLPPGKLEFVGAIGPALAEVKHKAQAENCDEFHQLVTI
jgi:hypothetical protein